MNQKLGSKIIDCDVHHSYKKQDELYPYLPEIWVDRIKKSGLGYPQDTFVSSAGAKRTDAKPTSGVAGSDIELLREQLFDEHGVDYALLNGGGIVGVSLMPDFAYPTALARAYNDWLVHEWLEKDERFLGSAHVAIQDPAAAAQEIRRVAVHSQIKQVFLPAVTPLPMGHPFYRPILQAIEETGLVLAFHPKQPAVAAPHVTPVGMPHSYLEWHTLAGLPYMAQMVNMVASGVFELFPNLKVMFIEGGVSWVPSLLWRFDKNYRGLRQEAPWLKMLPSEYVLRNCKFCTQPIEEPLKKEFIEQSFAMMEGWRTIVFSTDYPHWDFDDPVYAMRSVPKEWRRGILYDNAAEFYGLNPQ